MVNIQYENLIVKNKLNSIINESYRTIKANIDSLSLKKKLKTIMIASAVPQKGLDINTVNIALTLADNKKKIIVVDCDLYVPRIHQIFNNDPKPGLTNVLLVDEMLSSVIRQANKLSLNLYYITSGPLPPNPAGLIGSEKMKLTIEELKKITDIAIFYSPPVIGFSDTLELARLVDGVILILNAGEVTWELAKQAKVFLERAKANLLGVIINNVDLRQEDYFQYLHQYNYKKYFNFNL